VTEAVIGVPVSKADTAELLEGLSEVSRMATLLASDVLDAQIMKRPVPDSHIRSLLEAALLLREYGHELPSLLSQIVHEVDKPEAEILVEVQHKAAEAEDDVGRLAWLFRPFPGTKGLSP
jgi:hypothetical protein